MRHWPRRGVTLIELIVVLAILGIVFGVAGVSMSSAHRAQPLPNSVAAISRARSDAILLRRSVTLLVRDTGAASLVTALPDGSVVGARPTMDGLTGRLLPQARGASRAR